MTEPKNDDLEKLKTISKKVCTACAAVEEKYKMPIESQFMISGDELLYIDTGQCSVAVCEGRCGLVDDNYQPKLYLYQGK